MMHTSIKWVLILSFTVQDDEVTVFAHIYTFPVLDDGGCTDTVFVTRDGNVTTDLLDPSSAK